MVSNGIIALFVFLSVIIVPLITWGTLAYSGCTPKNDGLFGMGCNPFPFGKGGSCGGSSGGGGTGTCSQATDVTRAVPCAQQKAMDGATQCVDLTSAACKDDGCCDWKESYRRFNRSPRREGYRRFTRR